VWLVAYDLNHGLLSRFSHFQILVLIGADSFSFLIENISGKVWEFILFGKGQPCFAAGL
jgi:hypothetical protein